MCSLDRRFFFLSHSSFLLCVCVYRSIVLLLDCARFFQVAFHFLFILFDFGKSHCLFCYLEPFIHKVSVTLKYIQCDFRSPIPFYRERVCILPVCRRISFERDRKKKSNLSLALFVSLVNTKCIRQKYKDKKESNAMEKHKTLFLFFYFALFQRIQNGKTRHDSDKYLVAAIPTTYK